jgi:hypothetical protein
MRAELRGPTPPLTRFAPRRRRAPGEGEGEEEAAAAAAVIAAAANGKGKVRAARGGAGRGLGGRGPGGAWVAEDLVGTRGSTQASPEQAPTLNRSPPLGRPRL